MRITIMNIKFIRYVTKFIGSLSIALIALLSLVPGGLRPHTGSPKQIEHFIAYTLAAAILTFGFGRSRHPMIIGAALCLYAAALEVAQTVIPDRDGNVIDFLVSSSGAVLGCLFACIAIRTLPKAFA